MIGGTVTRPPSRFPLDTGGGTVLVFTDGEFSDLTGIDAVSAGSNEVHYFVGFCNGDYHAQPYELSSAVHLTKPGNQPGWYAVFKEPISRASDVRINYVIVIP